MDGKPHFRTGKMRQGEIDQAVDAAVAGTPAQKNETKEARPKRSMSQAEFSGYGKARRGEPPEEMMRKHRGMREGGEVGRGYEECKGYGAARKPQKGY